MYITYNFLCTFRIIARYRSYINKYFHHATPSVSKRIIYTAGKNKRYRNSILQGNDQYSTQHDINS